MSAQRPLEGGPQRSGRFTVTVSPQHGESDADEAEQGSADTSAPSTGVERTAAERAAEPNKIESLHKLQAILEAQHHLFTKTWEDMKEQVYHALLHRDGLPPPQQTRPNTPTSTYSTSSCRTPPCAVEHRGAERGPGPGGSAAGAWAAAAGAPDNARESTLQMWSHLGDTLREVVQRNEQLEEENHRLQVDLAKLQQRITDAQQAMAAAAAGAAWGEPFDGGGAPDFAPVGLPPRLPAGGAGSDPAAHRGRRAAPPPREAPEAPAPAPGRRPSDACPAASLQPSEGEESVVAEWT